MEFEQCKDVLLKESELVQCIAGLQNIIRDSVVNRDWTDFEEHFNALQEMGKEFTALEDERERIFSSSHDISPSMEGAAARFYVFASNLPAVQRNELTDIYRNLKLEVLRVQVAGEALMSYIAGVRATMAGFFEIAFPDRSGKIYTPYGVPVTHDMRSMVLNQCF